MADKSHPADILPAEHWAEQVHTSMLRPRPAPVSRLNHRHRMRRLTHLLPQNRQRLATAIMTCAPRTVTTNRPHPSPPVSTNIEPFTAGHTTPSEATRN